MINDWRKLKLKFRLVGLQLSRLTLDKVYPRDPNPEHWRTINGSKVHLTNGKIDGGAGGKFRGNTWTGRKKGSMGGSPLPKYIGPKTASERGQTPYWMVPSKEQMHRIGKAARALSDLNKEYIIPPETQKRIDLRIKGMYEGMYSPQAGFALIRSLKKILKKRNNSGTIPQNVASGATKIQGSGVIINSEEELSKYLEDSKKKYEQLRVQYAFYGNQIRNGTGDADTQRKYNDLYQQMQKIEKESHTQKIKAAKKGISALTSLSGKCDEKHIRDIQGCLKKASPEFLTLWNALEYKARPHPDHKGGAYMLGLDTYFDIEGDSKDRTGRKARQTYFHEHGHFLDRQLSGYGNGHGGFYSTSYNNGEFIKAIQDDVNELVKNTDKRLKAEFKDHLANGDLKWFQDNGFISKTDLWGVPVTKIPSWFKYRKGYAYQFIRNEVRNSDPTGQQAWSDLSDILQGATKDKIHCGWGHKKAYWNDPEDIGTEAFAEFTSAHLVNKESLRLLNKYLPKASAVYLKMISEASAKEEKRW